MTMQHEAIFEAPAAHEAIHYSNPYSNPELELEWESHEGAHFSNPYSNPELEEEWEAHPEFEWETHEGAHYSNPYSNPELEEEWETHEGAHYSNPYSNPELEEEWETHEGAHYSNPYSNPEFEEEWEDEGEFFFKRAFRAIGRVAKRLAPFAVKGLVGMIPGVGAIAAPLAGKLTSALLREAEMEVAAMEAEFFGSNESHPEVANTEGSHEAALTELLAAEAAQASTESEAEAVLATALPLTITIMGGRRALRPVTPILAQANGRLVRSLRQQGPAGRQLLRAVPTIQRQAIATMKAAARTGQPITAPLAVRAMAAATQRLLTNPRRIQRVMERNAILRRRVAPPSPRRAAVFIPNRVAPMHPRRMAGFQPMRATPLRRRPI
jgi:hypothetical protein